jgi:hypothetical protein
VGREVVRVPPDFKHPVDDEGQLIVGAHHEALYYIPDEQKTAFQIYENVTEGSPVSPIFGTLEELSKWLAAEGWSEDMIKLLIDEGFAPSLVIKR